MNTRGWPRAAKAQVKNENQPQLSITIEIVELRQVVQQQAELMQRQRNLHSAKINCLRRLCKGSQFLRVRNRVGPVVEEVRLEVRVQPPQPSKSHGQLHRG